MQNTLPLIFRLEQQHPENPQFLEFRDDCAAAVDIPSFIASPKARWPFEE